MIQQLLLALGITTATVLIHAAGFVYLVLPLAEVWGRRAQERKAALPVLVVIRLVSGLLFLHLIEMGVWAVAFYVPSILPDFETSLYFSLTSYTTVGYGDVILPSSWRLLGPLEAAVGVLMLGLSTGFIVAALPKVYSRRFGFTEN
jgi:hypothetical protein